MVEALGLGKVGLLCSAVKLIRELRFFCSVSFLTLPHLHVKKMVYLFSVLNIDCNERRKCKRNSCHVKRHIRFDSTDFHLHSVMRM